MAGNLAKWPSKRGPVTKIMPSVVCGESLITSVVERGYGLRKPEVIWEMSVESPGRLNQTLVDHAILRAVSADPIAIAREALNDPHRKGDARANARYIHDVRIARIGLVDRSRQ